MAMNNPRVGTIEKVEAIVKSSGPITPTGIVKLTGIPFISVKSSIDKLKEWNHVETISDGRLILIRHKVKADDEDITDH